MNTCNSCANFGDRHGYVRDAIGNGWHCPHCGAKFNERIEGNIYQSASDCGTVAREILTEAMRNIKTP